MGIRVAPDAAATTAGQTETTHIRLKHRPQSLSLCLWVSAWIMGCPGDFAFTTCSLFRRRAQPLSLKACTCSRVLKANLSAGRRCQANASGAHPEAITAQWAVGDSTFTVSTDWAPAYKRRETDIVQSMCSWAQLFDKTCQSLQSVARPGR